MIKYYLNLTNGIEFLEKNNIQNLQFVRLQSTACEQKRWEFILQDLDYSFYLNLAIGNTCIIIDYSARKQVPRSIYQGLEWIKFVLYKVWYGIDYIPFVNGNNCEKYFEQQYMCIKKSKAIKKVKYFKKFLNSNNIKIDVITGNTNNDSKHQYYFNILKTKCT